MLLPQTVILKVAAALIAVGILTGGGAYLGYQYRDGKAAQEALALIEQKQEELDQLHNQYNVASLEYEVAIQVLRDKKQRTITKIVEKEVENTSYSCVLPPSSMRTHRTVLESLREARNPSKSNPAVSGSDGDGTKSP